MALGSSLGRAPQLFIGSTAKIDGKRVIGSIGESFRRNQKADKLSPFFMKPDSSGLYILSSILSSLSLPQLAWVG